MKPITANRPYLLRAYYEWLMDNHLTPHVVVDAFVNGTQVPQQFVKDGQIVVGNTMMLSLACDHRTVDGAVGAGFLQTLKTFIENPVTMIA